MEEHKYLIPRKLAIDFNVSQCNSNVFGAQNSDNVKIVRIYSTGNEIMFFSKEKEMPDNYTTGEKVTVFACMMNELKIRIKKNPKYRAL